MARTLAVVLAELRVLIDEATDLTPVTPPDPDPSGGVIWDSTQVVWDPAQVVWSGGGTSVPGTIRVNVGQPVASAEGSGGQMIRVNVGQSLPSAEGSASQVTRVTAGQPAPSSEGNATLIRVTPGQPAPSNEGN